MICLFGGDMSNKETGGKAFPTGNPTHGGQTGMDLRDYFAAQMLASVFSAQSRSMPVFSHIAQSAYEMADAMIQARNK